MKFENVNKAFDKRKANSKTIDTLIDNHVVADREAIALDKIIPFTDDKGNAQPFIINDEDINVLAESIKKYGLLTPITVRELADGQYQLLSGHKRYYACKLLEKPTIDCKVIECDSKTAYFIVCHGNLQRQGPKPSELNKMFHTYCDTFDDETSVTELSKLFGVSSKTLYRCLHLDELIPDLVNMVDIGTVSTLSVEIIDVLNHKQQAVIVDYINETGKTLKPALAKKIVELADEKPKFNVEDIDNYIKPKKKEKQKYNSAIYNRIYDEAPELLADKNEEELDKLIISLLEEYQSRR